MVILLNAVKHRFLDCQSISKDIQMDIEKYFEWEPSCFISWPGSRKMLMAGPIHDTSPVRITWYISCEDQLSAVSCPGPGASQDSCIATEQGMYYSIIKLFWTKELIWGLRSQVSVTTNSVITAVLLQQVHVSHAQTILNSSEKQPCTTETIDFCQHCTLWRRKVFPLDTKFLPKLTSDPSPILILSSAGEDKQRSRRPDVIQIPALMFWYAGPASRWCRNIYSLVKTGIKCSS